jgi:hypothetical protein
MQAARAARWLSLMSGAAGWTTSASREKDIEGS